MTDQTGVAKEVITQTVRPERNMVTKSESMQTGIPVLAGCVALGDWLLWGYFPGLSFALFLAALASVHLIWHFPAINGRNRFCGLAVLAVGLVPLLEVMNLLTFVIASISTFSCCMILRGSWPDNLTARIDNVVSSVVMSGFRFPAFFNTLTQLPKGSNVFTRLSGWLVPVVLAAGFVVLFQEANPVLQNWLLSFDIKALLEAIFSLRSFFWLVLAWVAWPLIEGSAPVRATVSAFCGLLRLGFGSGTYGPSRPNVAFFERCLILFNGVFAIQTMMDLTYLWGGARLPDGMGYAEFAHRGAYPLLIAAILAGLFVTVAMRPGGAGEVSKRVKVLVLVWVLQNLMLVASSVLRLELYVSVYALTYWRVAAFIWMGLVAAGLVLIVARFVTGRSGEWLLNANVVVLALVLYGTSLVNFPAVIMSYNLSHIESAEAADWYYLDSLGGEAYPALLQYEEEATPASGTEYQRRQIEKLHNRLRREAGNFAKENWRSWSFRWQRAYWATQAAPIRPVESSVPDTEIRIP